MALHTYNLFPGPGTQWLAAGNDQLFSVSVPAGSPTVTFSSDSQGQNNLATVAGGGVANFSNYGGFFYTSAIGSTVAVNGSSVKLANVTSFTNVVNTGAETVTAQFAIPANFLFNGSILKVRWQARCSSVTGTPTLAAKLYLGAAGTTADTALQTAPTTALIAAGIITGETEITVGAASGAAVPLVATGSLALAGAIGQSVINSSLASTNFATNGILYLTLTLLWSAASASNAATATLFTVEII